MYTFWREAATGQDQLKRRVAFALSQIFVISLQDANLQSYRRGVASYMDMLTRNAFGNYRQLLQDVTLHPMMGLYLSHLRNRKEDPALNRVPDQNYAREVMQLFSIGLYQLNPDGTLMLDGNGQPIETYGPNDIVGLSRVFTGFSWAGCPNTSTSCFNGSGTQSPNREVMPMQSFPQFHSISEKTFPRDDHSGEHHSGSHGRPEPRARRDRAPSQRRPVHRAAAHPAPGDEQPIAGVRRTRRPGIQFGALSVGRLQSWARASAAT